MLGGIVRGFGRSRGALLWTGSAELVPTKTLASFVNSFFELDFDVFLIFIDIGTLLCGRMAVSLCFDNTSDINGRRGASHITGTRQ